MENQLFQYSPSSEGNTENGYKVTFGNDIMSVLGLDLGNTAKYGLNPREFPRVQPEGTPEGAARGNSRGQKFDLEFYMFFVLCCMCRYILYCVIQIQVFKRPHPGGRETGQE